jgi:ABC-2 type transport system ATP-binding protein
MNEVIIADHLVREFKVTAGGPKGKGLLPQWLNTRKTVKRVVDEVSFKIRKGEFVGYLGPNGAGKSTTIKMLSGVLVPTSGRVEVLGLEPYKHRQQNARSIGVLFGQRSQLWWDLPLVESFRLLAHIYSIPKRDYQERLNTFTKVLQLDSILHIPVRQLSLGQRMCGDIAAALLHGPEILFLDEPTIGLDIIAKTNIQSFLRKINEELQVTVILTTHNLDDIEKLCKRVIFIDQGRVIFDGPTTEMVASFGERRYLIIDTGGRMPVDWKGPEIARTQDNKLWFSIEEDAEIAPLIGILNEMLPIVNLTVKEPGIEEIIKHVYDLKHMHAISS